MAQTVEQMLTVTPAGSETATITLDGDRAEVSAGAAGVAGSLRLVDDAGVTRIDLQAQNQRLRIRNEAGQSVCVLGPGGDLLLGGSGSDARLRLQDDAGVVRIDLDSDVQRLRIRAADGSVVVELGPDGNLTLGGGGGSDGDLSLKDAAGTTRIGLDAENNRLRIRNSANQVLVSLGDNANLSLGGNGSDGDITLIDTQGTARIELDAENQRIRIRNASGQEIARLGDFANLRLGGNGSDGDLDLLDENGQRRVLLGAGQQALDLFNAAGEQVCSLGPNSNLRLGGHGSDGDILLYPENANDLFDNAAASIHLDANAGDITLRNADCAEEFEVWSTAEAEPGTVMALADDGRLRPSCRAYETGVVGVVSGAGAYRPGIVLDKQPGRPHRRPIAMIGKVCVKVTDECGAIGVGDLLVASSTPGHAMRAADPRLAFGAVIGKAIAPHARGSGSIPMLIALQ